MDDVMPQRWADAYAMKLAAEYCLRRPFLPDLSDEALANAFADCVRVPKADQYGAIREAFMRWRLEESA